MQCIIPTLNTALVFTLMIHGDLTPSNFIDSRASLLGITQLLRSDGLFIKLKLQHVPCNLKKGKLNEDRNNTAITYYFHKVSQPDTLPVRKLPYWFINSQRDVHSSTVNSQ